ncbi:MAG: glycosyltransferase family 4 protein [Nitrososphaerota archaeon]|nr:glycosyltransferase family 4 protein [Nitrososphaerota archaeon]
MTFLENLGYNRIKTESKLETDRVVSFDVREVRFKKFFGVWIVPRRVLHELRPDVIYVSTFNAFFYLPILGHKTIMGSFVIGPEHEKMGTSLEKGLLSAKKLLFGLTSLLYNENSVIFHVLNPSQGQWLERLLRKELSVVVNPPPLDCSLYTYDPNRRLTAGAFRVTYLGPLTEQKGFKTFDQIIRTMNERPLFANKVKFTIVGDGVLRNVAEGLAKRFGNVNYLGILNERQNIDVYRDSHLVVSPSQVENFHYVTAEAQLCGVPVVSSDLSGPRSIIQDETTGKLIKTDDTEAYVMAIKSYLDIFEHNTQAYEDLREKCRINGMRFCKDVVLPKFEDIILRLGLK